MSCCPQRRAEGKRDAIRRLTEGSADGVPVLRVRQVMTPNPLCVPPTKAAVDLVEMFFEQKFHHLLVTEHDRLVGVISDRDVVRLFGLDDSPEASDLRAIAVGDLMSLNLVTVTPETSLRDAVQRIVDHDIHCLPVVDDEQRVQGIVTSTDLFVTLEQFLAS